MVGKSALAYAPVPMPRFENVFEASYAEVWEAIRALVKRAIRSGDHGVRAAGRYLRTAFAAAINATFSPRLNAPSDQLAPGGRRPGMAAPTLDTQGEAR